MEPPLIRTAPVADIATVVVAAPAASPIWIVVPPILIVGAVANPILIKLVASTEAVDPLKLTIPEELAETEVPLIVNPAEDVMLTPKPDIEVVPKGD